MTSLIITFSLMEAALDAAEKAAKTNYRVIKSGEMKIVIDIAKDLVAIDAGADVGQMRRHSISWDPLSPELSSLLDSLDNGA